MKPPKCKVCGREHGGPCYSTGSALAAQIRVAKRPAIEGEVLLRRGKLSQQTADAGLSTVLVDDPGHNPAAVARFRRELHDRLDSTAPPITVVSRLADAPKRGRPISDKPKSPRAEYQRELMRKRRSKT